MVADLPTLFMIALLILGIALISSCIGVGGGILFVPILLYVGSFSYHEVAPLSLSAVLGVSSASTIVFLKKKKIDFRAILLIGPSGILGALIGVYINISLSTDVLEISFISLLLGISMIYIFTKEKLSYPRSSRSLDLLGVVASLGAGIASGALGIGGGPFFMPILQLSGVPIALAPGSSQVIILMTSVSGIVSFYFGGKIDLILSSVMFLCGVIGAFLGSHFAIQNASDLQIQRGFGIFVLVAVLVMILTRI